MRGTRTTCRPGGDEHNTTVDGVAMKIDCEDMPQVMCLLLSFEDALVRSLAAALLCPPIVSATTIQSSASPRHRVLHRSPPPLSPDQFAASVRWLRELDALSNAEQEIQTKRKDLTMDKNTVATAIEVSRNKLHHLHLWFGCRADKLRHRLGDHHAALHEYLLRFCPPLRKLYQSVDVSLRVSGSKEAGSKDKSTIGEFDVLLRTRPCQLIHREWAVKYMLFAVHDGTAVTAPSSVVMSSSSPSSSFSASRYCFLDPFMTTPSSASLSSSSLPPIELHVGPHLTENLAYKPYKILTEQLQLSEHVTVQQYLYDHFLTAAERTYFDSPSSSSCSLSGESRSNSRKSSDLVPIREYLIQGWLFYPLPSSLSSPSFSPLWSSSSDSCNQTNTNNQNYVLRVAQSPWRGFWSPCILDLVRYFVHSNKSEVRFKILTKVEWLSPVRCVETQGETNMPAAAVHCSRQVAAQREADDSLADVSYRYWTRTNRLLSGDELVAEVLQIYEKVGVLVQPATSLDASDSKEKQEPAQEAKQRFSVKQLRTLRILIAVLEPLEPLPLASVPSLVWIEKARGFLVEPQWEAEAKTCDKKGMGQSSFAL